MAETRKWVYLASVFAILMLIFASTTIYYYSQYADYKSKYESLLAQSPATIRVNLLIDFGNGTSKWFNSTAKAGISLLDYTIQVTNGQVAWIDYNNPARPTYTSTQGPQDKTGAFVISILGVTQDGKRYWMWYYYAFGKWNTGPVGAGSYILGNNSIVKWSFEVPSF